MADTMQFDLVSPERRLMSGEVREVQLPGSEGDMTAMPDHAPLITTLRPGVVAITSEKGVEEYAVFGGFAEISPDGISVLAERALPVGEVTQQIIDDLIADARKAHEAAQTGDDSNLVDATAKTLADMVAVGGHIGLSAS